MKNILNKFRSVLNLLMFLKKLIKLSFIFFPMAYIITSSKIVAQEHDLRFRHLTIDDGLSQNTVNCICQDSRGFMWFGTNHGINKYDGYEFTIYPKDDGDSKDLSDDFIKCIFKDSDDNLWIGTGNGGLNLFDRISNNFIHFNYDSSSEVISSNDIRTIIEDSRGNIWLGTGNGISLVDLENKKIVTYFPSSFKDIRLNNIDINVMFEDRQNNIWVGTLEHGLCLFDRAKKTYQYFRHDINNKRSISDDDIRTIYEDHQGNLWIGTYNGGFNLFDREKKLFYRFFPDPKVGESLTVKAILDDGKGNLWIGTRNGLYLFNKKTHQFIHYAQDPHNPYSLSQNNIQVIYKDSKGDFWFGTKEGINFLNTTNMPFVHYRANIYDKRCLNQDLVSAIFEDNRGDLWFGTVEGGLNRLNRETGIFTYYTHDPEDPNSLGSNNVNTINEDEKGNLWIGTFQGGLNLFNRKENRFIHYKLDPDVPLIYQGAIHSLFLDRNDELWIGSVNGLHRFNKNEQSFIQFPLSKNKPEPVIRCIIKDNRGKIWIGSNNGKIYCIDKTSLKFEFYKLPTATEVTIINIIIKDRKENFWIGTSGKGLHFFDTKQKSFKVYTKKDGLANNIVNGILEDERGNLWISTINGLSKFDPEKMIFKNYYKENGLQSNQFTDACCKTRSGEMFFGGINGVTAFYPNKILESFYIPPVIITDFKVFNKSVKIGGENPILSKHISEATKITLSYKHSVFSFNYAALDFGKSEQIQYAYMMEGFEKDWNYVGKRRFATYTNLNPGTYKYKVKVSNNDRLLSQESASIKILISPPYWKSWWFKIIIAALFLLTIRHFVNYQAQKRNLLKATALANLTQLKLLRNQMNPHFLINTLSSIRALILIDKDQAWQMITKLSEFFRYLLLNFNKVEASLDEEIDAAKNYISIQKVCFYDSLNVLYKIEDSARECIVPAFIFQPLIENAIKHGKKTSSVQLKIKIQILYNNGVLSIDVSNTGTLTPSDEDVIQKDTVHGTSIKNIEKRLGLMFKDQFAFQLYEKRGWVHAKIRINYEKKNTEKLLNMNEI